MSAIGDIVFVSRSGELAFADPVIIFTANRLAEVKPCLQQVAEKVSRGFYAAGFLAYETAPAFDPALCAHPPGDLPLAWFGLYHAPSQTRPPSIDDQASFRVGPWKALVSVETYRRQIGRIRDLIVAGDTYQINYTFPLQADFHGDTLSWFRQLCASQQADHCAFIQAGRFHLLSASPELFFKKDASTLTTRPMKGTIRRGRWPSEDRQAAQSLAASPKERAENVMIVDVLRNDMSRVSRTGSVNVTRLWELERYPTVWQMTSTVVSQSEASIPDILAALFPSGSVTGAPKIHATEIIRALEPNSRGIYCGTIGWWAPGGQAEFNVAIRTVAVDTDAGIAHYHVGGGITHGSSAEDEYAECLAKAEVLTQHLPVFDLLESLRWDGRYFLLREHLDRLAESAAYFDFPFSRTAIETALNQRPLPVPAKTAGREKAPILKIRLLLHRDGSCRIEDAPLKPRAPFRVGLAATPVNEKQVWLYHKTTYREVYRQALLSRPDCEDVILWNQRGEITESTMANVVLELDGKLWTPPVACGLLAGTFRRQLLETGVLQERVLCRDDLRRAHAIRLINSVRQWMDVQWMEQT
ncbi:MAG: aminodeoxychorismate synthase component I [Kiritimatiellae bacterium]|nr:aminodeoxychorismate synthase component I [Kiritimatiellia bacterium]